MTLASQVVLVVKNLPANARDMRYVFDLWIRKILWRRAWQPAPVFVPGECHGQRSLAGYSPGSHTVRYDWSNLACSMHASCMCLSVSHMRRLRLKEELGRWSREPQSRHPDADLWAHFMLSSFVCCPSSITLYLMPQYGCDYICINLWATSMSPLSFCFYLFFNALFWLCWVFIAAHEPSLVAVSGATLHCG